MKWDNNLWLNCDRGGHGHGASDGNFAHVTALYQMLDTLRQKYPQLVIENCSSGGNRMDFGMLRYTDAAWMDDRTAPSVHVRHNIDGLSLIFPPAYLLSFVTNLFPEPLRDSPDLSLYVRSRMARRSWALSISRPRCRTMISTRSRTEIALYKSLRPDAGVGDRGAVDAPGQRAGGPGVGRAPGHGGGGPGAALCLRQRRRRRRHRRVSAGAAARRRLSGASRSTAAPSAT